MTPEERLLRFERGVVEGLRLLRQGQIEQLRAALEQLLDASVESAEALEPLGAPAEPIHEPEEVDLPEGVEALSQPFVTDSMAQLLERQGDRMGSAQIRERLDRVRGAQPGGDRRSGRPAEEVLRILGDWLRNLEKRGGLRA